jgi:hypothetical protein
MTLLGAGMLFPYNALITAGDYFNDLVGVVVLFACVVQHRQVDVVC